MSMVQGVGEYFKDDETTTTEATDAGDWSDWKGTSKASKSASSKGSKDWWSGSPTVSNAPSAEKEWSAGKSGKATSTKSSKSGSSKDSWGKPEPVRISMICVLAELALLVHTFLSHAHICLHSIIKF